MGFKYLAVFFDLWECVIHFGRDKYRSVAKILRDIQNSDGSLIVGGASVHG